MCLVLDCNPVACSCCQTVKQMGQSHRVVGLADRVLLDRTLVYRTSFQSLLSLASWGSLHGSVLHPCLRNDLKAAYEMAVPEAASQLLGERKCFGNLHISSHTLSWHGGSLCCCSSGIPNALKEEGCCLLALHLLAALSKYGRSWSNLN